MNLQGTLHGGDRNRKPTFRGNRYKAARSAGSVCRPRTVNGVIDRSVVCFRSLRQTISSIVCHVSEVRPSRYEPAEENPRRIEAAFSDVYIVKGDPTSEVILRRAKVPKAHSVVVLTDDREGKHADGKSILTCITIRSICWGEKQPNISAECRNPTNRLHHDRRRTQAAGFNHHLVKPVSYDELLKLLRSESS
jgi:hypothetical protein